MTVRYVLLSLILWVSGQAAYADNIAACEVILMEPVLDEKGQTTGGEMASFRPAAEFLSSVYDDEDGFIGSIDGFKIKGVMCQRRDILPTLRDFPIVKTGLPFALSENFDSSASNLLTIKYKAGEFVYDYKGAPLSDSRQNNLDDILMIFNLQPHDLKPETDMKPIPKDKHEAIK